MVDFDLPEPPTPDARFSIVVEMPPNQKELSPSHEDTIEAEVSKKASESGLTDQPVSLSQNTSGRVGNVMGGGSVIEPPELNALDFAFREDVLSVSQLSKAQRIIAGTLREYEVPANEEDMVVRAVAPIDLGSL